MKEFMNIDETAVQKVSLEGLDSYKVAKMIDHSLLHPAMTDEEFEAECQVAIRCDVGAVCVKPYHVKRAAELMAGTDILVSAVIAFPHGNSTMEIKLAEAKQVLDDGATEVDYVINMGKAIAAEFGEVRIPDWTADQPGADTRLEALCSGWGIQKRLRKPGYVPVDSSLNELCEGETEILDCKMLEQVVHAGDAFAIAETDRVAKSLAIALTDVLCLFQPQYIAIGGGVSLTGEPLFERIRLHVKEREFVSNTGRYEIVPCQLGEDVVLVGALLLASGGINS